MDIGGWLRDLGLARCEQAFRDNEIDERVVPKLTADDLKELGTDASVMPRIPRSGARRIAGSLIVVLCITAASGSPEAASEPISKIEGSWRLININDGLAAALAARSADGTDVQLAISCRPDEPKTLRLLLAYFDDAATDNSAAVTNDIHGAHLQNMASGRKLPIAFLGMSPHFDKTLNHKSSIFFFSFDRDWLPEIWKGDAIRLNFTISSEVRHLLPNIQIPLSDSFNLVKEALQNCTKHTPGEETFDFDERSMGFGVHSNTENCDDCGWIFARGVITESSVKNG